MTPEHLRALAHLAALHFQLWYAQGDRLDRTWMEDELAYVFTRYLDNIAKRKETPGIVHDITPTPNAPATG